MANTIAQTSKKTSWAIRLQLSSLTIAGFLLGALGATGPVNASPLVASLAIVDGVGHESETSSLLQKAGFKKHGGFNRHRGFRGNRFSNFRGHRRHGFSNFRSNRHHGFRGNRFSNFRGHHRHGYHRHGFSRFR